MPNRTSNSQTYRQDSFTIIDVCGGMLVLLIFLVPTILAVAGLDSASHLLAGWIMALMHSGTQGGFPC